MTTRDLILAGLNRVFRLRGMELRPKETWQNDSSMDAALARAARITPHIETVVDVGAAAGTWTTRALRHFPRAAYLLIEPLAEREPELTALKQQNSAVEFALAAAGEAPGEVTLNVSSDLDGSGIYGRSTRKDRRVPMTTIDGEIASRQLRAPYFIKLDSHGYERPILNGARQTLENTALLMIEAYNFVVSPGSLRFHELCSWLETLGFRPSDLLEPVRRAHDGLLWQMDLVFARRDHPAFRHTSYR
jgi:FkbM family methyltransferase